MNTIKIWQVIHQNMFEVTNYFEFEAAHRLAKGYKKQKLYNGYIDRGESIHGHSFKGSITIVGTELHRHGFLLPNKKFNKLYADLIDDLDHSILLYKLDNELVKLCKHKKWKYMLFNDNPTPETLSKWLYKMVKDRLIDSYCEIKNVVIETKLSKCKYYE